MVLLLWDNNMHLIVPDAHNSWSIYSIYLCKCIFLDDFSCPFAYIDQLNFNTSWKLQNGVNKPEYSLTPGLSWHSLYQQVSFLDVFFPLSAHGSYWLQKPIGMWFDNTPVLHEDIRSKIFSWMRWELPWLALMGVLKLCRLEMYWSTHDMYRRPL